MYADAWLALIPSACITLTRCMDRLTAEDIYLTAGNLKARTGARAMDLSRARDHLPEMIFGLTQELRYTPGQHAPARPNCLTMAGLALGFAAINAANEEFRFRLLLARGKRATGASAVLWTTSLNFGLAHWNGRPGGPTGVSTTALFAMRLCRSLYDTEGGLWAWLIDTSADIIILILVAVLLHIG